MSKPILEIRCNDELGAQQYIMLSEVLSEKFGSQYYILILDDGMSAHIHDKAILYELREIKQILKTKA